MPTPTPPSPFHTQTQISEHPHPSPLPALTTQKLEYNTLIRHYSEDGVFVRVVYRNLALIVKSLRFVITIYCFVAK